MKNGGNASSICGTDHDSSANIAASADHSLATPKCRCGQSPPHPYNVPVIFRREEVFYPIVGTACEDWAHHAEINPGTLAIEDMAGKRLWPEGSQQ